MYESLITPATPAPASPEQATAALPVQRQPANVGEFVNQNLPLAQRVAEKTGVAPEVLLGQWGLETGWGNSVIPGTNNLGNIKDPSRRGPMATDNMTGSRDAYLQFETPDDFGNHYSGLIARRYASAMNSGGDAQKFFSELKRNGYAEDPAYVQSGMRAASMAASALGGLKPAAPTESPQYYSPQRGQYASLITPPPERGFAGAVADTGLALAQGAVGAVQSLTDLAGANNPVSDTLGDASKFLQTQKSAQSQATLANSQQRVQQAEASGDWTQELGAYMQMLWDQPAEMLAQGVGSFATLGVGKLAQAAKLASSAKAAGVSKEAFFKSKEGLEAIKAASDVGFRTNVGVSAAQGVGAVKGSQYEQTFNAAKAQGRSDQEAAALADQAQAYGGEGTGQQLLGGVLGAGAASVGPIERLVAGRGAAKAAGIPGGTAKGFLVEGGTEGAQGGQERYAGNAAAIDAGVLDESKRYQGVAGQMALEGTLGGVLGGGAGALESALAPAIAPTDVVPPVPPALQPVADKAAEPNSPLSRAAMASAPLAAATQANQQAAEQAAVPAKPEFDDIFQRAKAIEDATRTNNGLQALRQDDAPVNSKQFLNDLAVAKSQSTNPALREQALSRLEFAAEWAGFDVAPPEARPATEPAAPLDQVGQAAQMAQDLTPEDRSQVVAALASYRNPALPQATRDAALGQALEIIGRNQAGQMPTQPAGQPPAVLGDIAPQPGTPEYFIREAERREQGAEQFRAYGFPDEAAALQAEADSLRENAASARAGELGMEMPADSDADIATPAPQQTVEQATQNLPRVPIPAPVAGEVPSADNTAARRKRKAQLGQLVSLGFGTAESRGGQYILKNAKTGQEVVLEGPADFQLARAAVQQAQRATADSSPNSPTNDKTPASEAKIAAGNYAKPADVVNGIPIRYENPAGSTRSGTDPGGKPWSVTMKYDYGHDDRVVGADGDKLDIKVGRNPSSPKIFVVDQVNPDGSFDEHKVVLGANSEEDARQTYLADYEPGWQGLGAITEITKAQYDEWTRAGTVTEPMMLGREDKMFTVSDGGVPVRLMAIDPEDMGNPSAPRSGKGKLIAKKDAELIKAIGLLFGLNTQFFRSMTPGWSSDGFYQGGNTLYLSERTTVSPLAVFGHEFMHLIKRVNPKAYAAIAKVVSANVKDPKGYREDYYGKYVVQDAKGETITYMRDQKRAELAAAEAGGKVAEHGTGPLNEAELEEMVSDLNGNLMTDSKFWGEVFRQVEKANGAEAKGIISQLAAFLNRMIDQLVDSLKGRQFNVGQFVNETKAVRNAFRDGLATFITESGGKVRAVELQAEILRATQKAKKVDVQRSPEREGGWSVIADKIPTRAAAQQMLETLDAQRYEFNIVADPEDNTLQIEARRLGQGERSSAIVVRQKQPRAHTQLKKIGPLNWTAITDLSLEGLEMLISTVTRGNTLVSTEITRSGDGISQREIRQTKPGPINQMSIGNEHKSILSMIRSARLNDRLNTGFMPEIRKSTQRDLAKAAIRDLKESDISNEPGLSYDTTASGNGVIELNRLDVEPEFRWKGAASRFMDKLTEVADKKGVAIELEVGSGTDDENIIDDLPRFYSKWGFVWSDGYMRREPGSPSIRKSEQRGNGLTVEAYHFSQQPRPTLSTDRFGTGLRGSGRDEIMANPRTRRRLSFYVNKGDGIRPEGGVGSIAHKATLTNIYDADADPLRMRSGNARDFEVKVMDAGYNGYLQRMDGSQPGQVILLGDQTIQPEILGPRTRITDAAVVPPPMLRVADLADRINNNRNLPSGALTPQRWAEVLMMQMPSEAAELLNLGAIAGNDPMYQGEFASAVRRQASPMRKSTERAEYAEVEAKYRDSDEWLKAPNGKATKLSERQWVQTRTPSFLKWFGDWLQAHQDGGVWATKLDVSKVVTPDGEPMVVYHGSDEGGFVEFKRPGGTRRGDLGIFTTDNYGMARSYVHLGRTRNVVLPGDPTNQAELEAAGYSFDENDDGEVEVVAPDGYLQDRYPSLEAAVADTLDNLDAPDTAGDTPGVYALFVNLRNPNESNFEGAYWSGERLGQYMVVDADGGQLYKPDGSAFFDDRDEAQAFADANDGTVEPAPAHYEDTDSVVREAIRDKADGAIIREVIDDGGGPGYDLTPSDIFVALDPTQLKSADYNDGAFSPKTGDLRKSEQRQYSLDIERQDRVKGVSIRLTPDEVASVERDGAAMGLSKRRISELIRSAKDTKRRYPPAQGWAPVTLIGLDVKKDDNKQPILGTEEPKFSTISYGFNVPDGMKRAPSKIDPALMRKVSDKFERLVLDIYERAQAGDKNAQTIIGHQTWYRNVAEVLRREYGAAGDLLADLLGATSPNTPVDTNWRFSIEIMRRFVRGEFNAELRKFDEFLSSGGDASKYQAANKIRQISGKLYGMNSTNAMKALLDMWRVIEPGQAPKARNFALNLIGQSNMATIDVWAARMLRRAANMVRGMNLPRIPPVAEMGVSGNWNAKATAVGGEFGFGAAVMDRVSKLLEKRGIKVAPPDLQAIAWFAEKELWGQNGWTTKTGEGGSFEENIEASPVERYLAGWSIQQGSKVPERAQASVAQARVMSMLIGDSSVVAARVMPTSGLYGGTIEASFDTEWTATKGDHDPSMVMAEIARLSKENNQLDIFVSRVISPGENNANARPGVEIYFKTAKDLNAAMPLLQKFTSRGQDGFTMMVDPRANPKGVAGDSFIGVRLQYVPEISMRWDEGLRRKLLAPGGIERVLRGKEDLLADIAAQVRSIEGVAFSSMQKYDTVVVGKENYDEYIDRVAEGADRQARTETWFGSPLRYGLERAVARLRGDLGQIGAGRVPDAGGRLFGGISPDDVSVREQGGLRQSPSRDEGPGAEGAPGQDDAGSNREAGQRSAVGFGDNGRSFTGFFSNISAGLKGRPNGRTHERVINVDGIADFVDEYNRHRGNFDDHIAASIPGFREVQTIVGSAIASTYTDADMLDIGASEGALVKAVTKQSDGGIRTVALDPNFVMAKHFRSGEDVPGSIYVTQAFGQKEDEGQLAWAESDELTDRDGKLSPNPFAGEQVTFYKPDRKFDVVHEAMVFQFISGNRVDQVARAKQVMKPDGVLFLEEKFVAGDGLTQQQFRANEEAKDQYKEKFFTKAEIAAKAKAVGVAEKQAFEDDQKKKESAVVGMNDLMKAPGELEAVLRNNFSNVVQFWDSGNFKGYMASDSAVAVSRLLDNMPSTESEFSTIQTPRWVTGAAPTDYNRRADALEELIACLRK